MLTRTTSTDEEDEPHTEVHDDELPRKKAKLSNKTNTRFNKFCTSWFQVPEFKNWLLKSRDSNKGHEMAFCKVCDTTITAHKSDILRHSKSEIHKLNWKTISDGKQNIPHLMKISSTEEKVRRAELKLTGLLATNNLPCTLWTL